MTRPIKAKSGTPCYGAAGDAVEIQQAGGMQAFKLGLLNEGFRAGYAVGQADAKKDLESRLSKLESAQRRGDDGDQPRPGVH